MVDRETGRYPLYISIFLQELYHFAGDKCMEMIKNCLELFISICLIDIPKLSLISTIFKIIYYC